MEKERFCSYLYVKLVASWMVNELGLMFFFNWVNKLGVVVCISVVNNIFENLL